MKVSLRLITLLGIVFSSQLIAQEFGDENQPHPIDVQMDREIQNDPSTAGQLEAMERARKQWDELLNRNYQAVLRTLPEEAQTKLRRSQQTWVLWRDLEIEALESIYSTQDGTMWGPAQSHSVMNLTRERALRLGFFLSLNQTGFEFEVRGSPIEILPFTRRVDIKEIFQKVAPEAAPSVDTPTFLQYDIVLTFGEAPASFVFDFDQAGILTQVRMDAFQASQIPTVIKMVKMLRDTVGPPKLENGAMVWRSGGWTLTHHAGGEGEDSVFSMTVTKDGAVVAKPEVQTDYDIGYQHGLQDAQQGNQYRIRGGNQTNVEYMEGYNDGYLSVKL